MSTIAALASCAARAGRMFHAALGAAGVALRASQIVALLLFAASVGAFLRDAVFVRGRPRRAKSQSGSLARVVDAPRFRAMLHDELRRVAECGARCAVLVVAPRSGGVAAANARATLSWAVVGACSSRDIVT